MDLILTHEQADFDALGALLGAYLARRPEAGGNKLYAVLPRRVNRNARSFITFYGADFPFVDQKDLPSEAVEKVLLVDTQSLNTIRGMGRNTRVHVVDHHPRRGELPEGWTLEFNTFGACTTQFVTELRERGIPLNHLQATLLLLGIYEDTGSLTYVSTTPQDIYAAAYLLENGARLQIANDYLNPPLSPDQLRAFDQLLASSETLVIHGQKIILTRGNLESLSEEISSVAHKIRDLLDPDGLFIIVQTAEGVRLVARSTTDQINVATVTGIFGGGGHDRAAGALIHENFFQNRPEDISLLDYVYQRIREILPDYVQAPLTVRQIMSLRPRTLAPGTLAHEASQWMQRYGYEGFPVVENSRVQGLLTRRAVDRALAHKLDLAAASLMDAGEVTISPSASIQDLQRLMTETSWGQIPVVDPDNGDIIGIVTRTDLLKVLSSNGGGTQERKNLAGSLESALPRARLALLKAIGEEAYTLHQAAYVVGGFVRDLVLNRPSLDFDIVIEGDAIAIANALVRRYGGRFVSHSRFGTAKWQIKEIQEDLVHQLVPESLPDEQVESEDLPESLDLISARMEFYDYPTALPTVERSSIKLDLHRRDFTINTMAIRLDGHHYGELYDYWGGLSDLKHGIIRVLHSLSFVDDPTRMLRAIRFEQRFRFRIDSRTLQLMSEARPILKEVSGQRLRHELDLILSERRAAAMLARLEELELLEPIQSDLFWDPSLKESITGVIRNVIPAEWQLPWHIGHLPLRLVLAYLIWLIRLPEDTLLRISECLRFPSHLRDMLIGGSRCLPILPELENKKPSEVAVHLDPVPLPALYALYQQDFPDEIRRLIYQYAVEWKYVQPETNGMDLQRLGIPPGPIYRHILEDLRSAWLDGMITSSAEEKLFLESQLKTYQ